MDKKSQKCLSSITHQLPILIDQLIVSIVIQINTDFRELFISFINQLRLVQQSSSEGSSKNVIVTRSGFLFHYQCLCILEIEHETNLVISQYRQRENVVCETFIRNI